MRISLSPAAATSRWRMLSPASQPPQLSPAPRYQLRSPARPPLRIAPGPETNRSTAETCLRQAGAESAEEFPASSLCSLHLWGKNSFQMPQLFRPAGLNCLKGRGEGERRDNHAIEQLHSLDASLRAGGGFAFARRPGRARRQRSQQRPNRNRTNDRQNRHRELHQKAQERFAQARERLQTDRQTYRKAVDESGKDSPQAREAGAKLRKDKRRVRQAKKRFAKRHGQLHRRRAAQRNSGQARPGAQGRRRARAAGGRARGPGRGR